jgi:glycosyltransferase involved in cell wall biosynthesis
MKILLVEPFGYGISHSPQYVRDTSLALAEAGVEVTVVTFEGTLGDWTERSAGIKHASVVSEGGVFARPLHFLSHLLRTVVFLRPFNLAFDTFFTFRLAIKQNIRERYDVVHVLDASMPVLSFLAFASTVKNYNLVFTLHSTEDALRENVVERLRFTNTVKDFLYRRAIRKNRIAFICFSETVRGSFKHSVFYDRINFVPDPRPKPQVLTRQEAREHLNLSQEAKVLLSFGINHNWKNYEVIFQAVQGLPRNVKLLFAGRILPMGAKQNDPRRFAEKYDLMENTIIVDEYIPEEEVPYYFCAADAIIISYRNVFSSHSSGLLDASQYGLPVIAVNTGTTGGDVKAYNLGLTFTPEDPHSLREAVLSFLKLSEEEKHTIKERLQKFAATFSWEQVAKSHVGIYQSLLRR